MLLHAASRFETAYGLASIYLSMFAWCELLRKQYASVDEAWNACFAGNLFCLGSIGQHQLIPSCWLLAVYSFWIA